MVVLMHFIFTHYRRKQPLPSNHALNRTAGSFQNLAFRFSVTGFFSPLTRQLTATCHFFFFYRPDSVAGASLFNLISVLFGRERTSTSLPIYFLRLPQIRFPAVARLRCRVVGSSAPDRRDTSSRFSPRSAVARWFSQNGTCQKMVGKIPGDATKMGGLALFVAFRRE